MSEQNGVEDETKALLAPIDNALLDWVSADLKDGQKIRAWLKHWVYP